MHRHCRVGVVCGHTYRDDDHSYDEVRLVTSGKVTAAKLCCSLNVLMTVNAALVSLRRKVVCD